MGTEALYSERLQVQIIMLDEMDERNYSNIIGTKTQKRKKITSVFLCICPSFDDYISV